MRFGNGIHHRTPLCVWFVLAIGCSISLPGAALVFAQQESPQEESKKADVKTEPSNGQLLPEHYFVPQDTPDSIVQHDRADWTVSKHDVSKVAKVFAATQSGNTKDLLSRLGCRFPIEGASTTPENFEVTFETANGTVKLGNQSPTMHIDGTTLHVFGTQRTHEVVGASLQQLEKFGFSMIAVETHIMTMPVEELNKLDIDWSMTPTTAQGIMAQQIGDSKNFAASPRPTAALIDSAESQPQRASEIAAVNYVEQSSPAFHATLSCQQDE